MLSMIIFHHPYKSVIIFDESKIPASYEEGSRGEVFIIDYTLLIFFT